MTRYKAVNEEGVEIGHYPFISEAIASVMNLDVHRIRIIDSVRNNTLVYEKH
jgi:hypothetical protein